MQMNHERNAMTSAEKDFQAAIRRLLAKKPKHPELVAALEAGRLRISISSVAKEAGRARTLISHAQCDLPEIRNLVLSLMNSPADRKSSVQTITDLRREVSSLKEQLAMARSENVALLRRMERIDSYARKAIQQAERLVTRANEGRRSAGTSRNNVLRLVPPPEQPADPQSE